MACKAVLFDMGNVLVYFSHVRMCQQLARVYEISTEKMREILLERGLQWDFERGRIDEVAFHQRLQEELNRPLPFEDLKLAGSDIFWQNDEMLPVIDQLKSRGLRLIVVSNTCVSHISFIRERFDILGNFDDYVLSFEVGEIKPDQAMYQAAIAAAGCAPQECFYIDDIEENVKAGRLAGLDAELFQSTEQLRLALISRGILG